MESEREREKFHSFLKHCCEVLQKISSEIDCYAALLHRNWCQNPIQVILSRLEDELLSQLSAADPDTILDNIPLIEASYGELKMLMLFSALASGCFGLNTCEQPVTPVHNL